MVRTVVVVPCFNEAKRLNPSAFRSFASTHPDLLFILVNDGSGDETAQIIADLQTADPAAFRALDLPENQGKAEAVRRGFEEAFASNPELVAFWDADLATPLYEIDALVQVLESHPEAAMVFGSRVKLMGRRITRRAARHYVGRVSATAISMTLQLPVYDTQCGAKMFRNSQLLRSVFSTSFRTRWIFDVEIIARFIAQSENRNAVASMIYEQPVREWRDVEGSKVGVLDLFRSARDLWTIKRTYLR